MDWVVRWAQGARIALYATVSVLLVYGFDAFQDDPWRVLWVAVLTGLARGLEFVPQVTVWNRKEPSNGDQ